MPLPVKFLKSAVHGVDYPPSNRPEVALAGRSNAGKSSFLNVLTQSRIAKVSQEPGKTRLLNFFDVGQHYRIVDMPGYGFAARAGDEMREWTQMVEDYLVSRQNLTGLLLLMDVRREWDKDEAMLVEFMNRIGKPTLVIATKIDNLSKGEQAKHIKRLQAQSHQTKIWPVSSTEKMGVKEVEEHFFRQWIHAGTKAGAPK